MHPRWPVKELRPFACSHAILNTDESIDVGSWKLALNGCGPIEEKNGISLCSGGLWWSKTRFPSCGGRVVLVNKAAENVSPTHVFGATCRWV